MELPKEIKLESIILANPAQQSDTVSINVGDKTFTLGTVESINHVVDADPSRTPKNSTPCQ